mgnify:CR=1 FL=1
MINNEGTKIYPIELENVLLFHPDVIDAAVLGWPHDDQGEVAVAFVVRCSESLDDEAIITYCGEQISGYKLPHMIVYLPELPKNPMGKVLMRRLRETMNEDLKSRRMKMSETEKPDGD